MLQDTGSQVAKAPRTADVVCTIQPGCCMMVSWISLRDRCDDPQIQSCAEGMSYCTLFRQLNGCLHETVVNIFSLNFQAWNIIDHEAHSGIIDQSAKSVA